MISVACCSADIGLIGLAVMGQNLILNMNGTFVTLAVKRASCTCWHSGMLSLLLENDVS